MKRQCRFVFALVVLSASASPSQAASPKAPNHFTARTVSASEIRLAWSDNSRNETGFKIQQAPDNDGRPGTWSQIATVRANVTSFKNTGLPANTKYWYRVRAYDRSGESAWSSQDSATTLPRPPSNLTADAVSPSQVNLSWMPDSKGQNGFKIERSPGSNTCAGDWRQIAMVGASVRTYSDLGRAPDTTYWYRVRAYNRAGNSAYSSVASATTPAPCSLSVTWWGYSPGTPPAGLTGLSAIAAGHYHSLALKGNGTVVGWGDDSYGQATPPTNLTSVVRIAAGVYHSLALKSDGKVVGWGYDGYAAATPPTNLTSVVAIAAGPHHSLALRSDGTVIGWGYDSYGQTTPPTNLTGVVAIAAGSDYSLALRSDGTVVGWGYDGYGAATPPTNLTGVVAIAAGRSYQSLALKSDGTIVAWGNMYFGYFTPPTNLTGVVAIAAGNSHSLALKSDGTVVGWGDDYNGKATPVGLTGRTTAIAAGGDFSLALTFAPSPPSASTTIIVATNQIRFSWSDNSANEDGFKIQRAMDTVTNGPGTWAQIATVGVDATNFNDTGVMTNATYWYRAQAFNSGCGDSPYSQPLAVTVTAPTAPYSLAATVGPTNLSVSWYEYFASVDGFKLERATDSNGAPGAWTEIATLNVSNNTYGYYEGYFNDTGGTTSTTYWYRARAFNAIGDSPYSDPATVSVVPPAVPGYLSASSFADKVNLSWYNYSGEVGGFKIERALDNGGTPGSWAEIAIVGGYPYYNTYTDTGRTLNTRYWYRVRAFNWVGDSLYSNEAGVIILPPGAPNSITGLIGTANNVDLSWYENYGDQDGFKLERALDAGGSPGTWAEIATLNVSNTPYGYYTDTNVTAYTTNWYRVRAFNLFGDSPYSAPTRIDVVPPTAPSFLSANPFADRVNLSWYGYYGYYGVVEGYKIERAPDVGNSPGAWAEIATVGGYTSYYTDPGRAPNTKYWYRVRAFNWIGDSPFSMPANATILPPAAPYSLTALIGTTSHVDLAWYAPYPQDQDGFKVERALDAGGVPGAWTEITTVLATNFSNGFYSDPDVTTNLTYWYRVRAFNWIGDSPYSSVASVSVVPPPAPPTLTANSFRDQINLSWYNYYGYYGIVDGFKLERAPDIGGNPGTWTQIADVPAYTGYYTDLGRAANATYWYRLRTYNWIGESPYSEPASATILAPAIPSSLMAMVGATNQVDLWWYDSYGDQDGFKLERASDDGGSPGTWTEIATVLSSNASSISFTDTNVTANTTNWYRVRAFNLVGASDYTDPRIVRIIPPPAPYYVYANPFANNVNLSWYAYFYDYGNVDGFKVERALDVGGHPGTWGQIATITNVSRYNTYYAYSDTGGAVNTTYWYRVRAYNWVGDGSNSPVASATIVPPAAPYYLTATVGPTNRVNVSWYESSTDQDSFKLERSPDAGGGPGAWTEIATIFATNAYNGYYADTNVTANTTNWYRVRAFNVVGLSLYSDPASVRIVPPPSPGSLYASAYRDIIHVSWYAYYEGVDGFKLERAPDAGGSPGAWTQVANVASYVTSYSDPGQAANEKHWYRVRAYNWIGDGPYSDLASTTIVPPAAPSSLTGTVGTTNCVNLFWYDYMNDEDGFKLERAPDAAGNPGTWAEIATIYATNTYYASYTDTNVTVNTTNWYRVRAFNLIGISLYSDTAKVRVAPPDAPSSLSASPFANTVNLSWYGYYPGEIGGYKIERAPNVGSGPGAWTPIATTTNGGYYGSYTDPDRAANATYWYRVQAYNWVGDGAYSAPASATIVPPAAPYVLYATLGDTNRVDLYWYENPSDQDGFKIERAPDAGGGPGAWAEIATISLTNYFYGSYADTNVLANTTNWYRVRAFNVVGISPYSPVARVEIMSPGVPSSLIATAVASNRVNLSWYDYLGQIEGYKLERATNAGGVPGTWVQIAKLAGQYNSYYTDTTVRLNNTYWYRVRAYNWVGDSPYSDLATVDVSPPTVPANLTAINDWRNQIALNWANTSTNVAGFKIERAPDASGAPGTWTQIASVNSFSTNYADTGRTASKTYWYRVRAYNAVGNSPYSNEAGELVRDGQFVRVMQWNVEHNLGRQANNYNYQAQSIARIVNYNQPDVLLFNEIDAQSQTAEDIETALIDWVTNNVPYLGTQPGATFYVAVSSQTDGFNRNAAVSRYPILSPTTYNDGLRGLHSLQVQLSTANAVQVFHAHLKCCADDCTRKQDEAQFDADTISAFAATNALPYLFAGDWNEEEERQPPVCTLSGSYRPITTIREEARLGEFKPTTLDGEYRTWSSREGAPSIRFDYILTATNRFAPISGYVFSSTVWANHGLYSGNYYDSYYASDHYCVFANYYFTNPHLTVTPGTLASSGYPGGPFAPTNQSYTLSNASSAPLNWTAGKTTSWLDLAVAGGTLAVGATTNVTVSLNANADSLAPNVHLDTVSFTNTTDGTEYATRTVTLTVNTLTRLTVSPAGGFEAIGAVGGPFAPTNRTYLLSNPGIATMSWSASASANWLTLSAASGTLAAGASTNVTVSLNANANSLAADNYFDTIAFNNTTDGTGNATRAVSLTVTAFGFFDDFSTFAPGNLVGQRSWAQALASAALPLLVSGGQVVIPFGLAGDYQDAYKNFTATNGTLFYGLTLTVNNAPNSASPSYFAALYTGNNASGFANYRLTARDAGGGTYVLGARITGQSGNPYAFGGTVFNLGTPHRVIIEATSGGTVMNVFVDPTSAVLADQIPYLINYIGGGTPSAQEGSLVLSQFGSGSVPNAGVAIAKACIADNFANVYYFLKGAVAPAAARPTTAPVVQITSVTLTDNDVLISWETLGGTTNVVQAASSLGEPFTNLSPNLVIPGTTTTTASYLDVGAVTNAAARFYRIRLIP